MACRHITVVASLGSILLHHEALNELLNLLSGNAWISGSGLLQSICDVAKACSKVFVDLFENVLSVLSHFCF